MRPWEIKKLTPYQVKYLYGHPTDKNGSLEPRVVGEAPASDEERLKRRWVERYYLSAAQAEAKWREFLRVQAYQYHLAQQPRPAGQAAEAHAAEIERQVAEYERQLIRGR